MFDLLGSDKLRGSYFWSFVAWPIEMEEAYFIAHCVSEAQFFDGNRLCGARQSLIGLLPVLCDMADRTGNSFIYDVFRVGSAVF